MPSSIELPPLQALQIERPPIDRRVLVIAAAGAASSGGALVAAIVLDRPLWLASVFVFVPGFIAFVAVTVLQRREQQSLFLVRMRSGAVAGVCGLAAYDLSRWLIETSNLTSTNSFVAIRAFGIGLTDRPYDDPIAIVAGWCFHVVNGIGFALAYAFLAAGKPWQWAVAYALVLETCMIALYPGWLGFSLSGEFLSVSITAHLFYGAVLGVMLERSP